MQSEFFNYSTHVADSKWSRRTFLQQWRRLYAGDQRVTPPSFPHLWRALQSDQWPAIVRQQPHLMILEAVERRQSNQGTIAANLSSGGLLMERPVCAAAVLIDPRRQDRTGLLAMLRIVNDEEVLERLLSVLIEQSRSLGIRRLIGPTGLAPHLEAGALLDSFNRMPPLHTPYNPPYLPEILDSTLTRVAEARLFYAETMADHAAGARIAPLANNAAKAQENDRARPPTRGFTCERLTPAELQRVLGPLICATLTDHPFLPAPDADEAAFLLDWLGAWPLAGWIVRAPTEVTGEHRGQPVGYVLLQPDLAPAVARAGGGRNLLWRGWLNWRKQRPATDGRIVLGGVLPEWRRQGAGRLLWRYALAHAVESKWQTISAGPVFDNSAAAEFLHAVEAVPQQRYALYAFDL